MEPNEEMKSEMFESAESPLNNEPLPEAAEEALPAGRSNLDICPNCLEPNDDDLAVCRYCGQPLTPGAEVSPSVMIEDEQTLAANRAAAVPEKPKGEAKKQESGFRRVMPWIGLYLIYYAVMGVVETAHTEEIKDVKLAYLSWVIWFAAGVLMAWPLIKKGWNKIHPPKPKPEEPADTEANETEASVEESPAEYDPDFDGEPEAGALPEVDPDFDDRHEEVLMGTDSAPAAEPEAEISPEYDPDFDNEPEAEPDTAGEGDDE